MVPQQSRLLELPAELRNSIYELVSKQISSAVIVSTINDDLKVSDLQHPLSRTCRQLRNEFSKIAVDAGIRARSFISRSNNFNLPPHEKMLRFLISTPKYRDPTPVPHDYLQIITVDDNFGHDLSNKIKNLFHGYEVNSMMFCGFRIEFEVEKLSLGSLQHVAEDLGKRRHPTFKDDALTGALSDAIDRYRAHQSKQRQKAAKKRSKAGRQY